MPEDYKIFIGGKWLSTDKMLEVRLPFDNSLAGRVPAGTIKELDLAVASAKEALPVMAAMPAHKRAEILEKTCQGLQAQKEEFARTITLESGKPIREARNEVNRAVQTFKFAAEESKRIYGETIPLDAAPGGEGRFTYTIRQPAGVIAGITPFNFPLNLVAHKVAPALAAGNTIVLKPATATPMTALKLAKVIEESGIPKGALNVITGSGGVLGDALVTDSRIAMITFTGSAEVGKRIKNLSGLKKTLLELGSNCAVIVEEDANLDDALSRCLIGGYANSGQVCISLQRLYLHRKISKNFLDRFVPMVKKLKVGHPLEEDTDISSLITQKDARRVVEWIKEAETQGAKLICGGELKGSTVTPAVLCSVKPEMKVSAQELFGPVVSIAEYDNLDEAIGLVNNSTYGLQAGIYTQNLSKAITAAQRIEVGGVMVNEIPTFRVDLMPYGGVKDSGMGREGLKYAIEEMTEQKLVSIKL